MRHAEAVQALLETSDVPRDDIAVVGFHGHTILHAPEQQRTMQIGNGALLAAGIGIDVVADFRSHDVAEGGQGSPFASLYHAALASEAGLERPLAVLNLGGVGNVTWIGPGEGDLMAFDTGPGNALIDDWVVLNTGATCDLDGALARAGQVDPAVLGELLEDDYFARPPPKSLDRDAFDPLPVLVLAAEDGAATLTAFTAAAVARAAAYFPAPVRNWLVAGGGRHNPALMAALGDAFDAPVAPRSEKDSACCSRNVGF